LIPEETTTIITNESITKPNKKKHMGKSKSPQKESVNHAANQ